MIVLDASLAGALVLSDESGPAAEVEDRLVQGPLIAPPHWPLECANMLQVALRRQRIDVGARAESLRQLDALLVSIDPGGPQELRQAIALADRYVLTVYDASYLELALRRDASLASRDHALIDAAAAAGVEVLTF